MKKLIYLRTIILGVSFALTVNASALEIFVQGGLFSQSFDVEASDTIESLRAKIQKERSEGSVDELILGLKGTTLEDGFTLADYGIQKGDTINVALRLVSLDETSLEEQALLSRTAMRTAGMVLHGLHGHPLDYRVAPGKDHAMWIGGDWGEDRHGQSDGSLGIAEIGVARVLDPSGAQLGIGAGKSWSDHDTYLGGSQDMRGEYLLGELILPAEALGENAWMTLTGYYHQADAGLLRAYDTGSATDFSFGETDVDTWAFRARIDWQYAFALRGCEFSPYIDLSFAESQVDGYLEAGGSAPATFQSNRDHSLGARAGVNMLYELSPSMAVTGEVGVCQNLNQSNPAVAGEALGSSFNVMAPKTDETWMLGSIGIRAITEVGTVNLRLNGTTEGGDSTAWVSLLWSLSL